MPIEPILPFDVCRCLDSTCPQSLQCLRFIHKDRLGPRTPMVASFREPDGTCTKKIQKQEQ